MLVLLHLFALFLLVLLGFYIFVADPRSRANQTFAAFIAFLALWTTKDLIFWNFLNDNAWVKWWAIGSFSIALLMQYSLAVFAWVFPENSRTPKRRAAILFAPGLVLVPAAFFGFLWNDISIRNGGITIELTVLAYVFVAYVYFVFFYGAVELMRKYRAYKGTQKGQQLAAILLGLGITGMLKTAANLALPYFGHFEFLPYSSIFVLPGVLIYAYAITNFRLFSLQTALDQFRLFGITSKIALSIASVAIISFALLQIPIVWWSFRNGMSFEGWRRYLVFSIISALVPNLLLVLLIVRTISRPLQRITLAAVQVTEGNYGTQVDLRKSNDEIGLLANSFNEMSRKMSADIESLRSLNEKLARAERLAAMGTLAAGVAHEVNNPLASISSLVQMLRSQSADNAETREKLDLISTQIGRITRVTRDLTEFARVRPASRSEVDINEVIEASLRLASFDSEFQKLELVKSLSSDLGRIIADGDQLQQVFLNLLLNSRDAMPLGGRLSVSSARRNGEITISIKDSGAGISDSARTQLFDPFFTTKPAGKGTGLGLSVCYGIVSAHDGRIEVESESGGTVFNVILPASTK
ncbi:MAG: HAMP domain-containing protein [Pyrinomonadaceae bacterium]|nr:HAMP domain-containing protein [Blastocatellia bacterium]MCW5958160.1 HAMP domain-containing protein [Pyrinomonadaceae bacterium]